MPQFKKPINLLPRHQGGAPVFHLFKTAGIGVAVFIIGIGVWTVFPASHQTATIGDSFNASHPPILPSVVHAPFTVSASTATSALQDSDTTVQYYEAQTGRVLGMDLRTRQPRTISDRQLNGFVRSIWAQNPNRVVSIFRESSGTTYRSYDYTTGVSSMIGTSVVALAIAPDSSRVAYVESAGGQSAIFIAAFDGSSPRKIMDTRAESIELSWPRPESIILVSRRPDRSGRDMSIVGTDGTLKILLTDKENLEYTWSREGSQLLFSFFDTNKLTLTALDMVSGTTTDIPLKTSARKCAWNRGGREIVCGVPVQQELPSDVASDNVSTRDQLVRFDLQTDTAQILWQGNGSAPFSIHDPLVSDAFVVFTNLFDHRLYGFEL